MDFADSRVVDQSALQAIENIAAKYEAAGKRVMLRHLSRDLVYRRPLPGRAAMDRWHAAAGLGVAEAEAGDRSRGKGGAS